MRGRKKKEIKGKRVNIYLPNELYSWLCIQKNKSGYVANLLRVDKMKNPELGGMRNE